MIALVALLQIPFLTRAFHIDDPLFIWAARHIRVNPANPYGFPVNWYGWNMQMFEVAKNPPFASYYIALTTIFLGWSETGIHGALLLPALLAGIGIYFVANRFCGHPLLAAFAAILTPVFLVSGVTVMSDMWMLAFWVFAVYFWISGLDKDNHVFLAFGGFCIAMSAISKYFGMALIPLLLVYTIAKRRRFHVSLLYFLIPIGILAWYQISTRQLYGRGLLLDAAQYST